MEQPFNPVEMDEQEVARENRLHELGEAIAAKREEAVQGRSASGIEKVWSAAEEAYLGIDDANRSEWQGARWAKPTSMEGPVTTERSSRDSTKSTVFVPLTARYVDAGHAKVCEILLPIDDKPFSFEPTPIPELVAAREQLKQIMANGGQIPQPAQPPMAPQPQAGMPPGAMPQQPQMPQQPMPMGAPQGQMMGQPQPQQAPIDQIKQLVDQAAKAAKKAERRIYDWLIEARFPSEMRKAMFDSSRMGVGVIKGPTSEIKQSMAVTTENGAPTVSINFKVIPGTKWVDPWNCFPDPSCGEDVHAGDYFFERDFLSPRKLKGLKKLPGYLAKQIDKVLKEGPDKCFVDEDGTINPSLKRDQKIRDRQYQIWYFYGVISKDDVIAAKAPGVDPLAEIEDLFCIVTMVNDSVIRVVLNPLDSGKFPYRVIPWRRRAGHWAGVGVGEQVATPQKMINAATRAMLTNAGNSAGVQILIDNEVLVPADGQWTVTPNKIWYKAAGAVIDDIRKIFQAIEMPDRQQTMMNIIEYAFRLAEESTNIPLISQGQSGPSTPDTYGAAQLQNNNANQLLRNIAATVDDNCTEPLVTDFYEWLLLDPDVPNDEKGDYQVNAHGSTALVERSIQDQTYANLIVPALNPAYGLNPKLTMAEFLKSKRIDPRFVSLTEEEVQRMSQQQAPVAPQIEAAKIRAEVEMKKTEMTLGAKAQESQVETQVDMRRIQAEMDRDLTYVTAETERTQSEHQARMAELQVKRELEMLKYANQNKVTLDNIKADLAKEAMRLRTQKELAGAAQQIDLHKHHTPQVATPAVEPPGRAQPGQAFQQ
jgi:hypothetical protein